MQDEERDRLITEMHQDLKWVKEYIRELNKFKLAAIIALLAAVLGCII